MDLWLKLPPEGGTTNSFSSLPAALLDADRRREKIEGLAQPVDQIPFVRKMELRLRPRCEDDEGRRASPGLRNVQDFQSALPGNRRARLLEVLFEKFVQLRGGDSQVARVIRPFDQIR